VVVHASCLLSQLQRVRNAAARLVLLGLQPRDHIMPALSELHWLPFHLRDQFQAASTDAFYYCPSYTEASIPMGQGGHVPLLGGHVPPIGGHVPPIFMKGGHPW